jgi:acetyltransferase-like isoleucine patch superfamily enzyme
VAAAAARAPIVEPVRMSERPTGAADGDDPYVFPQRGLRNWWRKHRWYDRTHRPLNRLRINLIAARGGFFVRHPIEGEVLEALRDGRLQIGEGTKLEPGCWITMSPEASIKIGRGCFLNRETMLAAQEGIEIGDHVMFANHCFVGDADHRFDDPELPVPWQGFKPKGRVKIGDNAWLGKGVVVTGGVEIGERAVIGSNSVVTRSIPPRTIAAGAPATPRHEIDYAQSEDGHEDVATG